MTIAPRLVELGFFREHQESLEALGDPRLEVARVAEVHRKSCLAIGEQGEISVVMSSRARHQSASALDLPAVGDWIAFETGGAGPRLAATLARRSLLARKTANAEPQALAANVDLAFLVAALNKELNVRRLERYLALALDGGARPVVVLNKSDLVEEPSILAERVRAELREALVITVSAKARTGLVELTSLLAPGVTAVFLGSSGVGKSSLVNCILGTDALPVREARPWDDRGRHTTSRRQLIVSPRGLLVDTPGLREIEPWAADEGVAATFPEIDALIGECRFSDCGHMSEPGCALREAVTDGRVQVSRFESWRKLTTQQAVQGPWRAPKAGTRTPRMRKS
ncbi:MAG: ribosome small subunit-dependent GTPase A [Deltaproteobacteria bacterium]|nr:ribosome small subunit-dependent GTPase A [Deltaproteobacteria bacterium]